VTGASAHERFAMGLVRTFQIAHEFTHMTALENLTVVAAAQPGENLFNALLRPGLVRGADDKVRARAGEVLEFLNLWPVRNELAGNLSGGQKKLLELGRTLMANARAVLLDEVAAGVNRTLLKGLAEDIQRMNRELGYTFFVIEHDMDLISQLCDPVIVMAEGRVIAEGPMAEIRARPEIIDAYFGAPVEALA
jgi:branched-chain amino acid transport system ATP-binding protein